MYRLRWLFSPLMAKLGVPLLIKVDILYDAEAAVYLATSVDVKGLVVEAETLDELEKEVLVLVPELLALAYPALYPNNATAHLSFNQLPIAL